MLENLTEEQMAAVREIKWLLFDIGSRAAEMSRVYINNPWLNEKLDISNVVPMSVDEWYNELRAKTEEIDKELYKQYPTW